MKAMNPFAIVFEPYRAKASSKVFTLESFIAACKIGEKVLKEISSEDLMISIMVKEYKNKALHDYETLMLRLSFPMSGASLKECHEQNALKSAIENIMSLPMLKILMNDHQIQDLISRVNSSIQKEKYSTDLHGNSYSAQEWFVMKTIQPLARKVQKFETK
ncbi:hypothetical protein C9374_000327 [Naegleria lovaniensis]|uniref:Uncharacterized protein n=1 Tax=Naegleria lovaniensis TaxID=51637 RepID=A0AA88H099_NAELO|nr:uncharacterized protein C9374_000327 [Naegleria lovaniensis]KAG2388888.1 hypothetical protein C9374_000327 [Naegleria lovaniensis]